MRLLNYSNNIFSTRYTQNATIRNYNTNVNVYNKIAPMQDHRNSTKIMKEDLKKNGRYHMYIAHKLIDTDGRVYHKDYARFIPTEIQLNLKNKGKTPELANLVKDFTITKEIINRKETHRPISDFL